MSIKFLAQDVGKPKLAYRNVNFWVKHIITKYDAVPGDLTFIFCDDNYLLDINKKFLGHDYFTDIITFDYCEGKIISGDLFVSIERVKENSILFECSFIDEVLRVIIHGVMHLLGFGDGSDVEKISMRKMEEECIEIYRLIENGSFR